MWETSSSFRAKLTPEGERIVRQATAEPFDFRSAHNGPRLYQSDRDVRLHGASLVPAFLAALILLAGTPGFTQASAPVRTPQSQSAQADSAFLQARSLLQKGSLDLALSKVRTGLELAPRSVMGLNLLGIILSRQGNIQHALEAFKSALQVAPNSQATHNNLGGLYLEDDKVDLAENEYRATLRLDPRNRDANYNLGTILLARRQPRQAIDFLNRVQPRDAPTSFKLVEAYFAAGESAKALSTATALSAQAPSDVKVHFSLGVLLASDRQYQPAIHEFELADALKPGTFEILHGLGAAYLNAGEDARAEGTLERALALKPDSVSTLYLEARAYTDSKNDLKAFRLLFRARKLDPKNVDVIFLLARLSMMQNYFEDAIPLLERGVKIAPSRAELHAALGESYFSAGNLDKAHREFQILLKLQPSASSYAFMGLYYLHKGQFTEAKKNFQEGLSKDARNAQCVYNLGLIASKQGDFPTAEKFLGRALHLNPDYADALYELASVKVSERNFASALPLLRHYVELKPNESKGYYKLAIAERSLHRTQAADDDFKIFETLAKNPAPGPMPFQNFLEGVSQKVSLTPPEQARSDLHDLLAQVKLHPERPRLLYLLAETYLKLGQIPAAQAALARLRQVSAGDVRTLTGEGVLLARYKLYPDAIQYFQSAVAGDAGAEDAKYDLADAYFESHDYAQSLEWLKKISAPSNRHASYQALLGDTEGHLGRFSEAEAAYNRAIEESPDEDSNYLSLALTQLRAGDLAGAAKSLQRGENRVPDSGKILWGKGVLAVVAGNTGQAQRYFEHAQDLLPQWESGYSTLGTFYFETGQLSKARQTLDRYARLFPHGGLNVERLRQVLASYGNQDAPKSLSLSSQERTQFLAMALALADGSP
jgi:tetratricopeptide (TPR) repeat protein